MPVGIPTVFVLGAGASNQYGFPLGTGLKASTLRYLKSPSGIRLLNELGHTSSEVTAFEEELRYSGDTSVDLFLEHNPSFLQIGKKALAAIMLPLEDEKKLFPPTDEGENWYELLANRINWGRNDWRDNRLSVVTFNYDRSLEQYLARVLAQRSRIDFDQACEEVTNVLPIVHVHGSLGVFSGPKHLSYGAAVDLDSVSKASKDIFVVSEVTDSLPTFDVAYKCLREAKRIYFLGFGFLPSNVRRLKAFDHEATQSERRDVAVAGTIRGVTPRDWEGIKKDVFHGHWSEAAHPGDVYSFLRIADLQ